MRPGTDSLIFPGHVPNPGCRQPASRAWTTWAGTEQNLRAAVGRGPPQTSSVTGKGLPADTATRSHEEAGLRGVRCSVRAPTAITQGSDNGAKWVLKRGPRCLGSRQALTRPSDALQRGQG